jgi:protein SCO1/2
MIIINIVRGKGNLIRNKYAVAILSFLCALTLLSVPYTAHAQGAGFHLPRGEKKTEGAVDVQLFDLELLDQDGNKVMFKSDVISDKIVAMNFIFTNCPTVCPILTYMFVELQNQLGDRLGKDVLLISVSVDPVRDIPKRLRVYARKHDAGQGWVFLTGQKKNIDMVLVGLGAYSDDIWDHATKVLIGHAGLGDWTSLYGFPGPDEIMGRIDILRAKLEKAGSVRAGR